MSLIVMFLILVVLVETGYILLGKENLKRILKNGLEDVSGSRNINFAYGLYATEANDFAGCLKAFFQSVTLSDYKINSGWLEISYAVAESKIEDREAVKKAICIELHSYLLNNHGVDFWGYYIPVFTEDTVMLRIAASPAAEKEYRSLRFTENRSGSITMEE